MSEAEYNYLMAHSIRFNNKHYERQAIAEHLAKKARRATDKQPAQHS